jgi:hypothetical protein
VIRDRERAGSPTDRDQAKRLRQDTLDALDRFKIERLPNIPL